MLHQFSIFVPKSEDMKNQWKIYQMEKNIVDATTAVTRLLTNRVQTVGLLQLVLPIGWRLSKMENKVKYIERDIQCTPNDLNNVYMTLKRNKVHIYTHFNADFNSDFQTIRLNVIVDEYDRIKVLC